MMPNNPTTISTSPTTQPSSVLSDQNGKNSPPATNPTRTNSESNNHPINIKLEQFLNFSKVQAYTPGDISSGDEINKKKQCSLMEAIISFEELLEEELVYSDKGDEVSKDKKRKVSGPGLMGLNESTRSLPRNQELKKGIKKVGLLRIDSEDGGDGTNNNEEIGRRLIDKANQVPPIQLNRTLQMYALKNYARYVGVMKGLDEHIVAIENNIRKVSLCCKDIEAKLVPIRAPAQALMKDLKEMDIKRSGIQKHLNEVEEFLGRYTLTATEMDHLMNQPVDMEFMELMERLEELEMQMVQLVSQGQGEILGQDILNRLVECREQGKCRLKEYLQTQIYLLDVPTPELESEEGKLLCLAAKLLGHNSEAWMEQVVQVRHRHLSYSFDLALTRGNPASGNMRPIDLSASDPLRYVGDMIAWVHQALVEERELLDTLLHGPTIGGKEAASGQLCTSLDGIFSTVILSLNGRVRQVLETIQGPTLAFQIANLIQFYSSLLAKTIQEGDIRVSLDQLTEYAQDCFYQILEDDMAQLLSQADIPPEDLTIPESIKATIDDLKRILDLNSSSYNPNKESELRLVDGILNPLIQFCEREASFVAENERAIYVVNCLTFIQQSLKDFPAAHNYTESLDSIIQLNLEQLLELQYNALIKFAGLDKIMPLADSYHELLEGIVSNRGEEMSIQDLVGLCLHQHLKNIIAGLLRLEQFLYTVDLDQDFTHKSFPNSTDPQAIDDGDVVGLKRLLLPPREIWRLRSQALKHLLSCYGLLYPLLDKVMSAASTLPTESTNDVPQLDQLKKIRLRPVTELETLLYTPDL